MSSNEMVDWKRVSLWWYSIFFSISR